MTTSAPVDTLARQIVMLEQQIEAAAHEARWNEAAHLDELREKLMDLRYTSLRRDI